ncbi:hypothetical protein [Taibaiella soli]|nr:hypothetical protein [Taibaiella soli]
MQYTIHIAAPCNENWNNMTPNENGRHCDSCCKTVVDFTNWPLEDIAQYLQQNGKGNVCGHFRASQLNTPFETPEILANKVWQTNIPLHRKIAAVIVLFFAVTVSSCGTKDTTGKPKQPTTQNTPAVADSEKTHFDGNCSIKPFNSDTLAPHQTPKNSTYKKHKQPKTRQTFEANDIEPQVQGAVEMVPMDTNWRQHIPAAKSDSTNN